MNNRDRLITQEYIDNLHKTIIALSNDKANLIKLVEQCEKAGINYDNCEFGGYLWRAVMDVVKRKEEVV